MPNRQSNIRTMSVPTGTARILDADASRVGLIIATHSVGDFWITQDPNAGVNQGFRIGPNTSPLELTYERHGDLVKKGFLGTANGGTIIIGIIETNEF